jgi:hypothetical protein
MHARYKREHGSDGAHRISTTRGEDILAKPVPKAWQMIMKRRPMSGNNRSSPQWWQIQDNAFCSVVFLRVRQIGRPQGR